MKKEGIMRINSYSKFFAKVADIMNTAVKAVKQLDGRYKVELSNHVYLDVYRGAVGCLFIHDHRGIANTTSCYDFDDFKTTQDLYERLVSEYSESTKKDVMEVKQDLNSRLGKDQYFDTDTLQPNINQCPNQKTCCIVSPFVQCNYSYKSGSCIKVHKNFIHDCERLKLYISLYNQMKQTISYLRKCKTIDTYDTCFIRYIKSINVIYANGKISNAMFNFIKAKLSMQNVESGVWSSDCEDAAGYCKSRRYNKSRVGR